jgi:hypothetical protein
VPDEFSPYTSYVYTLDSSHAKYQCLWLQDHPILFRTAGICILALLWTPESMAPSPVSQRLTGSDDFAGLSGCGPSGVSRIDHKLCWIRAKPYRQSSKLLIHRACLLEKALGPIMVRRLRNQGQENTRQGKAKWYKDSWRTRKTSMEQIPYPPESSVLVPCLS